MNSQTIEPANVEDSACYNDFPVDHNNGGKLLPCGFRQVNPLHVEVGMDLDGKEEGKKV